MRTATKLCGCACGVCAAALCFRIASIPAEPIAEGGSPLYSTAVQEAIAGLTKRADQQAQQGQKPCPQCGKIHQPNEDTPNTNRMVNPAEMDLSKYYYCTNCAAYHPRKSTSVKPNPTPVP